MAPSLGPQRVEHRGTSAPSKIERTKTIKLIENNHCRREYPQRYMDPVRRRKKNLKKNEEY